MNAPSMPDIIYTSYRNESSNKSCVVIDKDVSKNSKEQCPNKVIFIKDRNEMKYNFYD